MNIIRLDGRSLSLSLEIRYRINCLDTVLIMKVFSDGTSTEVPKTKYILI